jgi:uncharacterized membrane protein YhaH (DUF805 family)
LRRAFDFSGRASRREFFLFHLIGYAIILAPVLLLASFDGAPPRAGEMVQGPMYYVFMGLGLLTMVVNLAVLVGLVAVAFRRVHDHDKSAWFLLLGLIPLIGWLFTLIWVFAPGDDYENSYGEDPRHANVAAASYEGVFD